ncbi:hypothetical protein E2562_015429 [Oryza meyeriana var. granulata]|uniref:Uncharacterized protein n=1 Tax=Oryza meyeriana var. granulata TaxID=110450 RepID=A0A6G1BWJ0_9ORYZ|nr:hypothetical protein E2562_015429 [Oryza meyeriana var. granulata]
MLFDTSSRPAIVLEELAVTFAGMYMKDPPLMLMQVTEFACGGFVVGVTWNHALADGAGMAQFLQAVGELARGLPSPTVLPVRWDYSLPELPPAIISLLAQLMVSCKPYDCASSYFTVPMSFINRVKAEFSHKAPAAPPCSLFEVVVAAVWQCRARATKSSDADMDDPVSLEFTANVRKQAQAKPGYYGNCFSLQTAVATRGEVANGDVVKLVQLVKDAKGRILYTFQMDGASSHGSQGRAGQLVKDTLYVSSWWNLGFDDVDFGSGSAARVMYNTDRKAMPTCILCGRKDKDGVGVMAFCVAEEHTEAFHAELGRLA